MKNLLTILTVLLLSQSSMSQLSLDLEKSKIKWTGKKITNASHWGSLSFSEANLDFDGDDLVGGKFIVDMNSMSVDDIQGRGKQRLEGHLRNEDFFDVENHKEAILLFNERVPLNNGVYEVTGTLTIKGISNPVKFTLIPSGNNYSSNLTFDRTKFEITYRSGNFFENLGDRLINDDVELEVNLVQ